LVHKVADFFMENKQFDKAVDLLAVTKKVKKDQKVIFSSLSDQVLNFLLI